MALALIGAPAPVIAVVDGIPTTTSVDVARHFGKRHDDVLKAIRNLLPQLPDGGVRNFAETPYTDPQNGQQYPAYRLTRDGFTLLAMGFTGKKALAFKLAYIDAFNRMEAELAKRLPKLHGDVLQSALRMAGAAGDKVQQAVFAQLLQGTAPEDLPHGRWLICMDHTGAPQVREIARDAVVGSYATIARNIGDPASMAKTESLASLAGACLAELARRAQRGHP